MSLNVETLDTIDDLVYRTRVLGETMARVEAKERELDYWLKILNIVEREVGKDIETGDIVIRLRMRDMVTSSFEDAIEKATIRRGFDLRESESLL